MPPPKLADLFAAVDAANADNAARAAALPVHCPRCAAERGVAIPASCPHVDDTAPRVWRVTTSNGRFYQVHIVVAVDEAAARALAESEDGANEPWILREEAADAAKIGEEPAGRYVACRIDEVDGVDPDDHDQIAFVDAGAEG